MAVVCTCTVTNMVGFKRIFIDNDGRTKPEQELVVHLFGKLTVLSAPVTEAMHPSVIVLGRLSVS